MRVATEIRHVIYPDFLDYLYAALFFIFLGWAFGFVEASHLGLDKIR